MDKLSEIVKFLQGKSANITVGEINQICAILQEQIAHSQATKDAQKESKSTK